jgi:glycosyltransferase involved in cell wall biosynthesis
VFARVLHSIPDCASPMILHVITNYSRNDGAQTMLARLLGVAQDERIVVVSLMDISQYMCELAKNPRVTYISLGVSSSLGMIGSVYGLAKILRVEKPTAILCWMYHAMIVGSAAQALSRENVPVVWNVRQSLDDMNSLSSSTRIALTVGRMLSHLPAANIYNSTRALELHSKYGYKNRNAIVIPNGFDLPAEPSFPAKVPRVFGIVGRFHSQKDHETFFRAAAIVARANPDARFKAAGEGLTLENAILAKMLGAVGPPPQSVELCGKLTNMPLFYNSIDVLVLSSRTEGFPNVVGEAMSFGKPVVTTNVGDAAAIVGNAGWVVPPREPGALAAAMTSAIDLSPKAYGEMARRARARIENEYELRVIERRFQKFLAAEAKRDSKPQVAKPAES